MTAQYVVVYLLEEDGDDPIDAQGDVNRYAATAAFDRGAADIMREARFLYGQLQKDGTLSTVMKSGGRGRMTSFDEESIAQAVIRRAVERRGSTGAKRAYALFKRHGYPNF